MKTLLKFGCGFFLFLVILFVALLTYGKSSGEATVREFFEALAKGSPETFESRLHPTLLTEVDGELFFLFLKKIQEECGEFQGLNLNGMQFSDNISNGVRAQEYKGTFRFSKKEVPLELSFIDGKLTSFFVKDQAIGNKALEATAVIPKTAEAKYAKKAEAFWQAALSNKAEDAFQMLHENVQKQFGREKILQDMKNICGPRGAMAGIKFLSSRPKEPGSAKSLFFFSCDFANEKNVPAHVTVEFAAMKGHLVGYSLPTDEKP